MPNHARARVGVFRYLDTLRGTRRQSRQLRFCPNTNATIDATSNATYEARRPARRKFNNFEKDRVAYRLRRRAGMLCQ